MKRIVKKWQNFSKKNSNGSLQDQPKVAEITGTERRSSIRNPINCRSLPMKTDIWPCR